MREFDIGDIFLLIAIVGSIYLAIVTPLLLFDYIDDGEFQLGYEGSTFNCRDSTLMVMYGTMCNNGTHEMLVWSNLNVDFVRPEPLYGSAEVLEDGE